MCGREFLYPRDIRTQERKEFGASGHSLSTKANSFEDHEAFKETFEILGKSKQLWRVIETFTRA